MTKKQSETRNNIRAKRRKRLLRAILGLFKLALLLCFLAAVGWGSWLELCRGAAVYREYHAKYENFRERREAARVPMDEKFEAYMNIPAALFLCRQRPLSSTGMVQRFLIRKSAVSPSGTPPSRFPFYKCNHETTWYPSVQGSA